MAFVLTSACAGSLPEPQRVAHPESDFVEVPYPPPAALVESVPSAPNQRAVWVDGYWDWARRYYVWQRGGWVDAPETARLAPWLSHYMRDGRLLFAKDRWFDESGRPIAEPKVIAPARTPPNEITGEFQVPR